MRGPIRIQRDLEQGHLDEPVEDDDLVKGKIDVAIMHGDL